VSEWSLSTLPSPIPELQHALLALKMLLAKERALTPPSSVVFYLDSHLSPLMSWECVIVAHRLLSINFRSTIVKLLFNYHRIVLRHVVMSLEILCLMSCILRFVILCLVILLSCFSIHHPFDFRLTFLWFPLDVRLTSVRRLSLATHSQRCTIFFKPYVMLEFCS
jgi:hypothetical protein